MIVRKRPETFDAWQFSGSLRDAPDWATAAADSVLPEGRNLILVLKTKAAAKSSDWIVRAPDGGITVVSAADFTRVYEEAR